MVQNILLKKFVKILINFIPIKRVRHNIRNKLFLIKYKQLNRKIAETKLPKLNFMYTTNTSNIGDIKSSPLNYFDFGTENKSYDFVNTINNNILEFPLLIGGGIHSWCFQNYEFYRRLNPTNNIAYGIGTFYMEQYPKDLLDKFSIIGLREYNSPMIDNKKVFFCPCASCMSSLFDIKYKGNCKEIVFYLHKQFTPPEFMNDIKKTYPVLDNYNSSFYEVIKFLSNSNIIVTNSYHGAYWATLLGKKVICIDIHNKCKGLKWQPVFANYDNWKDLISNVKSYPNALQEARNLNIDFYNRVMEQIKQNIK